MNPEVAKGRFGDPVIQFSIFADNKVGRLNDLCMMLNMHDVHIVALSSIDTTDSAIVRMIVNYPERARALFCEHAFTFNEVQVLAVELETEEELRKVTCVLVQAEINIHYIYAFLMRPHNRCGVVIRLEDNDLAREVLLTNKIKILDQQDIAR